jgi:hypothetical protein
MTESGMKAFTVEKDFLGEGVFGADYRLRVGWRAHAWQRFNPPPFHFYAY